MSFTKDDLRDGMVCTLRDGGASASVYLKGYILCERQDDAGVVNSYRASEWGDDLTDHKDTADDIMKITYGGKTVFERAEWRELTIDEAFELLKSGPVIGEGYVDGEWRANELKGLVPYNEWPFTGSPYNPKKFRIKK